MNATRKVETYDGSPRQEPLQLAGRQPLLLYLLQLKRCHLWPFPGGAGSTCPLGSWWRCGAAACLFQNDGSWPLDHGQPTLTTGLRVLPADPPALSYSSFFFFLTFCF